MVLEWCDFYVTYYLCCNYSIVRKLNLKLDVLEEYVAQPVQVFKPCLLCLPAPLGERVSFTTEMHSANFDEWHHNVLLTGINPRVNLYFISVR